MPDDFVQTALKTFGVVRRASGKALESRSGAGVQPVVTGDGSEAYAKLVPAGSGSLAVARRELRFYLEVAPTVPVRVPALLDHFDTDDGVGLLLAAAGETVDVREWTPGMWSVLDRDLAALHAMPAPAGSGWAAPDELRAAMADPDVALIREFWAPALPGLDEILRDPARLVPSSPLAFIHGDCHTENILRDGDSLVFCDWQNAGIGRPSADYALLSVRATPAGVRVPVGDDAEELAILIYLWPHYAGYNSPSGNARIRARAAELASGT